MDNIHFMKLAQAHEDLVSEKYDIDELVESYQRGLAEGKTEFWMLLKQICTGSPHVIGSWLYSEGRGSSRLFTILDALLDGEQREQVKSLLVEGLCQGSTFLTFDLLAGFAERLVRYYAATGVNAMNDDFEVFRSQMEPSIDFSIREYSEKLSSLTDGVDHLFPIPQSLGGKLQVLREAAEVGARENRQILIHRMLKRLNLESGQPPKVRGEQQKCYSSAQLERIIQGDLKSALICPRDYLLEWDRVYRFSDHPSLTLAELSRLALFCQDLQIPDVEVRMALLAYYRSLYRISSGSIIGLGAGPFYVEHGSLAAPSYFYMGPRAMLGKGCKIDGVGGFVACSGSFIGGGFMPLLIHTHKHVNKGRLAVDERKSVQPCVFLARRGARLPMSYTGLYEVVDYINKQSPFFGIESISVEDLNYD